MTNHSLKVTLLKNPTRTPPPAASDASDWSTLGLRCACWPGVLRNAEGADRDGSMTRTSCHGEGNDDGWAMRCSRLTASTTSTRPSLHAANMAVGRSQRSVLQPERLVWGVCTPFAIERELIRITLAQLLKQRVWRKELWVLVLGVKNQVYSKAHHSHTRTQQSDKTSRTWLQPMAQQYINTTRTCHSLCLSR